MKTTYNYYENGGTTPTEKERRETLAEKRAREAAGDAAFGDWSGRDARDRTPLTQDQIDLAFEGWPDDARELALKMYEAGTLGGDSFKRVKQKGEPLSLEGFNKMAFKDGDVSEGYLTKNLKGDYRKLFKKDGSFQLKDFKVGTLGQNVKNELIARGAPLGPLKKVDLNRFTLGTTKDKYYGDVPVKEEEIPEEVVETTPPEDLTPVETVDPEVTVTKPPRVIRDVPAPVKEETPDIVKVLKDKLEANKIGLRDEEVISDTLGTAATTSGGEQATNERLLRSLIEAAKTPEAVEKPNYMDAFQELEIGGRIFNRKRTYSAKQLRDMLDADRRRIR